MTRSAFTVGITLLVLLCGSRSAVAANDTVGTSLQGIVGEKRTQFLGVSGVGYYAYNFTAQRSYVAFCAPSTVEGSGLVYGYCGVDIRNGSDTSVGTDRRFQQIEPFPKGGGASVYTPTTTGQYYVRINAVDAGTMTLLVVETTLASPWYFVSPGGGYDSYVEVRNNTAQTIQVTVRAYADSGTLVGSQAVTLGANANTFVRIGADLGIVSGSGSVTITHDGMPAAVVANTTTLSGLTGLSFDSPFTPRVTYATF